MFKSAVNIQRVLKPLKVALSNAVVAGGIKAGFEANDYANGKSLTKDNLLKSTKEVGYSFFSARATTGMPILPVIGLRTVENMMLLKQWEAI